MGTELEKRLTRSPEDRVIAGVLGGIARRFGWDPGRLRLLYVVVSVLSAGFPGTLVYIALWFLMPEEKRPPREFTLRPPGE